MGKARSRERLATVIQVICVVLVTCLFLWRDVLSDRRPGGGEREFVDLNRSQWAEVLGDGRPISRTKGQVQVVVFADFQCPACRYFVVKSLQPIMKQYGSRLSVSFRHWPLSYHAEAYPAARASECAGIQGRFIEIHDLFYEQQDSLGLIPYQEFARRAGVPDLRSFGTCMSDQSPIGRVERDRAVAEKYQFAGTPTIAIDGHLLSFVPDSARFVRVLDALD